MRFFRSFAFFYIFFYIFQWDSHFLPIIITYYYFETRKLHIFVTILFWIVHLNQRIYDLMDASMPLFFACKKTNEKKGWKKKWSRNLMWHTWVLKCNVNCKSDAKIIPLVNSGNFYICNSSSSNSSGGSDSSICAVSLPLAVGSLDYLLVGLLIDGDEMQTHTHT